MWPVHGTPSHVYRRVAGMKYFDTVRFSVSITAIITMFVYSLISFAVQLDGSVPQATLEDFLVDSNSGSVTAASITGLSGSAVVNIETAQDLVLAVNPLSSGREKTGYGFSLTPARTPILPLSGKSYIENPVARIWGSTTISYAQNDTTVGNVDYRKTGFALGTSYYWDINNDPVKVGVKAFSDCKRQRVEAGEETLVDLDPGAFSTAARKVISANAKCMAEQMRDVPAWNATRMAIAFGKGWITPTSGSGSKESLGTTYSASAIIGIGPMLSVTGTAKHVSKEVDLNSLAGVPGYSSSNLFALRVTSAPNLDSSLQVLAEISNAKTGRVTAATDVFKYAIGVDKKIFSGGWLEFRFGKSQSNDGTTTQNLSLLTLKLSPTSTLFGK
jgi:hypothetical protein